MKTLGLAMLVSHEEEITHKYNRLLNQIGVEGMLMQMERFLDHEGFVDLINQVEGNLLENGIQPVTNG
jgi:hypothetical protein